MKQLLYELTMIDGTPANERRVRKYFENAVAGLAEIETDNLGSIIAKKTGDANGPRIMIAGHMDEIGFIVSEIGKDGYVRFVATGGWWGHVVLGQQFTITTADDRRLVAVVGSKPPHILKDEEKTKVVDLKDMYLDLGVASKEAVEALGVKIGDMIAPAIVSHDMNDPKFLCAKAFDNRIGVALAIEVLRNLQNEPHPNVVYGVGTVQEEVGLRGASTASYRVDPEIGIALDVTIAHDYPGGSKETELGKGPCLMIYDSSMVGHVGLRAFAVRIAEELGIPFQYGYLRQGGTDAGRIHLNGIGAPSLAICLPARYIHSHASIIHADDYENAVRLVMAMIRRLDRAAFEAIVAA